METITIEQRAMLNGPALLAALTRLTEAVKLTGLNVRDSDDFRLMAAHAAARSIIHETTAGEVQNV